MVKVKRMRTADCVVVGWRPGKEEGTVGSLILGLYDGDELRVVGHTSGFRRRRSASWSTELAPYETGERGSADPSRWAADRDLEWVALRPELVVEVTFDHVSAGRIRHGSKIAALARGQGAGGLHASTSSSSSPGPVLSASSSPASSASASSPCSAGPASARPASSGSRAGRACRPRPRPRRARTSRAAARASGARRRSSAKRSPTLGEAGRHRLDREVLGLRPRGARPTRAAPRPGAPGFGRTL